MGRDCCFNTLIIEGPREEIARFKKESIGFPTWYNKNDEMAKDLEPEFCFNALIPMPQEVYDNFEELVEVRGRLIFKGRLWMVHNWGLNHDIYNDEHKGVDFSSEDRIEIYFFSYDGPFVWVYHVARLFPMLEFTLICENNEDFSSCSLWCQNYKFKYYTTNVPDDDELEEEYLRVKVPDVNEFLIEILPNGMHDNVYLNSASTNAIDVDEFVEKEILPDGIDDDLPF